MTKEELHIGLSSLGWLMWEKNYKKTMSILKRFKQSFIWLCQKDLAQILNSESQYFHFIIMAKRIKLHISAWRHCNPKTIFFLLNIRIQNSWFFSPEYQNSELIAGPLERGSAIFPHLIIGFRCLYIYERDGILHLFIFRAGSHLSCLLFPALFVSVPVLTLISSICLSLSVFLSTVMHIPQFLFLCR